MTIELSKEARAEAIASLKRYSEENFSDPLGDLPAGLLLNFILEDIAPSIYNKAISDAQSHLERRIQDLNGELYADEFQYWSKQDAKRKKR